MQTVILPGYTSLNKDWIDSCADALKVSGIVRPINWDHWLNPENKFNAKEKAVIIARHARGGKINIVAKSIGSLVAAYIIEEIVEQINKIILTGIPVNDLSAEDKEVIFKALSLLKPEQVKVIQNESDPHGTSLQVKELIPTKFEVVVKPAEDHEYFYFEDFNEFLEI